MFAGKTFAAFLFDMDGTLLNSIASAERAWTAFAHRHGLDVDAFLPTIHGVRGIETITRLGLAGVDPIHEAAEVLRAEIDDVEGIHAIDGAELFLEALASQRWAIVTSSPKPLAMRRMQAAGIPMPPLLVTGDDVKRGKPAPDCFLLAAERFGVPINDCLVFEDAPAGIAAAEASGASVMVISATHQHPVETPHESIASYHEIQLAVLESGLLSLARRA